MTTPDGMQHRKDDAKYLYEKFKIDFYRTDGTDGNVLQTGNTGPGSRAHYAEDLGYWQTKGFYEVMDWLYANVPNFSYENCSGGGRIKDFGVMKRAIRIQNQDGTARSMRGVRSGIPPMRCIRCRSHRFPVPGPIGRRPVPFTNSVPHHWRPLLASRCAQRWKWRPEVERLAET